MKTYHLELPQITISTDQTLLDLDLIHEFIANTYWAKNIPRALFEKSLKNALCFGVYQEQKQIGFARVVSDFATFAYLGDVFILEAYRGKGYSKQLMQAIMGHPELQNLRSFCLATKDAQGLYAQFGFSLIDIPQNWMVIKDLEIYTRL